MRAPPPKGLVSQPAIGGDLGISGEWPSAPSRTISAVARTSTSASSQASARVSDPERARAGARSLCAATLTKRRSSQRRPHGLRLEVCAETVVTMLATDARGLETPERCRWVGEPPGVDIHRAGAQHRREAVGVADVARPHAGGETILPVVGAACDLLERVVGRGDEHGAEDLLAGDTQIVGGDAEQRGRDEVA